MSVVKDTAYDYLHEVITANHYDSTLDLDIDSNFFETVSDAQLQELTLLAIASNYHLGKIVLLRHGETEWSKSGKHTGRSDVALTPYGREQAKGASCNLLDYNFSAIYSSPLRRAYDTALYATWDIRADNPGLHVVTDRNLLEMSYGNAEGITSDVIRRDLKEPDWNVFAAGTKSLPSMIAEDENEPYFCRGKGEDWEDISGRAKKILKKAQYETIQGHDVLLVAHGHILMTIAAVWLGINLKEFDYNLAKRILFLPTAGCGALATTDNGEHVTQDWNRPPRMEN